MSRMVLRRIKLNIFFSIIYNAVGLVLGTMGMLTPVVAVLFQEGGCVTVVLSSTLLLWARPKSLAVLAALGTHPADGAVPVIAAATEPR
jgi:cation transport ATPase